MFKYLCGLRFSFLLGVFLGMEFLHNTANSMFLKRESARLFSKLDVSFHIPTSSV